jgi:hypothetical protein
MTHQNLSKLCLVLALGLSALACKSLTISTNDKVPPTFDFTAGRFAEGPSYLRFLHVQEIPPENQNVPWSATLPKENIRVWEIVPKEGNYVEAANLTPITYGQAPAGWIQKFPDQGDAPALVEGHVYEVGGPQAEVPHAYMRFTIRNGKTVRIPIPGFSG